MRARDIGALSLVLLGLTAAPAAASPSVSEYGTFNKPPWAVAAGPDGNIWFTENADPGAVGHIAPNGTGFVETLGNTGGLATGGGPYGITAGGDGSLYVTLAKTDDVVRVTPGSSIASAVTSGLTANAAPHGITWGPDGHVWFTESANDAVAELDPASGVVQEYATGTGSAPEDITVGPDNNLWFTAPGTNKVGKATLDGTVTTYTVPAQPWGIAVGADGNLWFTEPAANKVGHIAPDGTGATDFAPANLNAPRGIVSAGDGGLWVLSSGSAGNIFRIALDQSSMSNFGGLTGTRQPYFGALGPDGNLWFAEHASAGQLGKLSLAPVLKPLLTNQVTDTTADLRARIRANGQPTTFHIDYGTTTAYGLQSAELAAGSAGTPAQFPAMLSGLTASTTYHARVVATNASGTTTGDDIAFTTQAPPPPSSATPSSDTPSSGAPADNPLGALPPGPAIDGPPALGHSVGVKAVKGVVKVRDAKGKAVAFDGNATLPTGTVVDATNGTVELQTALDAKGNTQTGQFWGGAFKVSQPKNGKGMTVIELVGTLTGCGTTAKKASAAKVATKKKKKTNGLWGSDRHGRFQTRGKGVVATVRGTRWLTQDRCDGSLVRVAQGAVSVRDTIRHKTVLVRAGHSYLARFKKSKK